MRDVPKTARNTGAHRAPTFFYQSARAGVADMLGNSDAGGRPSGVLLPGYIGWSPREGSGVLDPVTASNRPTRFYDLAPDLSVDLASLESHLAEGDCGIVFVIHYFGRTDPRIRQIADLVHRHGAVLVEDLAHGFFSALHGLAGGIGDVSVFSLHKMFPLPRGGMVRYHDINLVRGQTSTAVEYAEQILQFDWESAAAARRENMSCLVAGLMELPGYGDDVVPLWDDLPDQDVPQTFPVRITRRNRDALYEKMNAAGVGMVSLYHTLAEEVRGLYPHLDALSRTVLNFPVHQDLTPRDMSHVVRVLKSVLPDC